MAIVVRTVPALMTSFGDSDKAAVTEIRVNDLYNAAFSEEKSIFPQVPGDKTDKVEILQGITNISLEPGPVISFSIVEKHPNVEDEEAKEIKTDFILLMNI